MSEKKILLSIIVPLYNEEKTLLDILKNLSKLKDYHDLIQIVVVNDGSTDRSQEILDNNKNLYDHVIVNSTNKGKGNAVRKGLSNSSGEYILLQDADLELDVKDSKEIYEIICKDILFSWSLALTNLSGWKDF